MRSLSLSKSGFQKLRSHQFELKSSDLEDSIKSLPPGEWCLLKNQDEQWIGFVNPQVEDKYTSVHVVKKQVQKDSTDPLAIIKDKISKAYNSRKLFYGYEKNARMFYGMSDGLPGLIIDQFENACIVQINTAGIDRYRDDIKKVLIELGASQPYFLDNPKYRDKESLPTYETDKFPELDVVENNLKYRIRSEVLQKVGFYFDHRENRFQLKSILSRMSIKLKSGVDLFSYAGAWGMSALSAGVDKVTFVDQGDFKAEVETALGLNGFSGRGEFLRSDVFKYLDDSISRNVKFDLVLCDPPAFAKSALQKSQALDGYSKLHRKVLKSVSPGGVVAFSSCTHYVSHEEFQKNILDAAHKESRKIQLIYSGMQGFDHPVSSLSDKSNYIKSYFYIVE